MTTTLQDNSSSSINSENQSSSPLSKYMNSPLRQDRLDSQTLSDRNLYVCGLPLIYNSDQLKELFSQFGPISETKVLNNTIITESKGVGFVHFLSPDDAQRAVTAMNNNIPPGMKLPLSVKFARDLKYNKKQRYPDVDSLPTSSVDTLAINSNGIACKYFQSGKCNRGSDCNFDHQTEPIVKAKTKLIRSFNTWGVIKTPSTKTEDWKNSDFSDGNEGELSSDEAPFAQHFSDGAKSKISAAKLIDSPKSLYAPQFSSHYAHGPTPLGISKTNLYVSQFPREWTNSNLEQLFGKFGEIDKIRILTPENADRNRGVGFVHFKNSKSALNAMNAMQNYIPLNCIKPIIVKFANQGSKSLRNITIPPGVCKFWLKGECVRGNNCSFRHESIDSFGSLLHPFSNGSSFGGQMSKIGVSTFSISSSICDQKNGDSKTTPSEASKDKPQKIRRSESLPRFTASRFTHKIASFSKAKADYEMDIISRMNRPFSCYKKPQPKVSLDDEIDAEKRLDDYLVSCLVERAKCGSLLESLQRVVKDDFVVC